MTPEFVMTLVRDYPLTTPLVHLTGTLRLDNFLDRTLNAWPSIQQVLQLF